MTRLEKCGTLRGVGGVVMFFHGGANGVWWLAALGVSLVLWALWDVARLEKVGQS